MSSRISIDPDTIAKFCRCRHITRLSLFGSMLRDDFGPNSDIDFLVEFEPDADIDLFDMARMEIELAEILKTHRKIDLRTPEDLSRYFRQQVLDTAEPQYVAAA